MWRHTTFSSVVSKSLFASPMANGPLWQGNTKSPGGRGKMRVQFEESGVGESQGNAAVEWAMLGDRGRDRSRAREPF